MDTSQRTRIDPPVVAVTGHRPSKIGGYEFDAPQREWVRQMLRALLAELKPQYCISGMALGVDQDFAFVCVEMQIPFVAAIPFVGQELSWPHNSKGFYYDLLAHAYCQFVVTGGSYSPHKMDLRNRWMVDNSDILIAVFDGSKGGTHNCVEYAESKKHEIWRVHPRGFFGRPEAVSRD